MVAAISVTPPGECAEHARLSAHLRSLLLLKRGCDNQSSTVALTVGVCSSLIDEVVFDVASELHRAIASGMETTASVEQRVPPTDEVVSKYATAARAQEAEAQRLVASGFFPPSGKNDGTVNGQPRGKSQSSSNKAPSTSKESADMYGRPPGPSKETAECQVCRQRVAASRFAHHLERCLGKGRQAGRRPSGQTQTQNQPAPPLAPPVASARRPTVTPSVPVAFLVQQPTVQLPKVRFLLNPKSSFDSEKPIPVWPPASDSQKRKKEPKTKTLASLLRSNADDVPLAAMVGKTSTGAKTTVASVAASQSMKSTSTKTKKESNKLPGVAVGKVTKAKNIPPKNTETKKSASEKKTKKAVGKNAPKQLPLDPFAFPGTAVGEQLPKNKNVQDSFSFPEQIDGDGSGNSNDDFELLFDAGNANHGDETMLVNGYQDLFA